LTCFPFFTLLSTLFLIHFLIYCINDIVIIVKIKKKYINYNFCTKKAKKPYKILSFCSYIFVNYTKIERKQKERERERKQVLKFI
jgi:hypothetical protein